MLLFTDFQRTLSLHLKFSVGFQRHYCILFFLLPFEQLQVWSSLLFCKSFGGCPTSWGLFWSKFTQWDAHPLRTIYEYLPIIISPKLFQVNVLLVRQRPNHPYHIYCITSIFYRMSAFSWPIILKKHGSKQFQKFFFLHTNSLP